MALDKRYIRQADVETREKSHFDVDMTGWLSLYIPTVSLPDEDMFHTERLIFGYELPKILRPLPESRFYDYISN